MFFILLFNALLALAELTATFSSRPILLKHKSLYVSPPPQWKYLARTRLTDSVHSIVRRHMPWRRLSWMCR